MDSKSLYGASQKAILIGFFDRMREFPGAVVGIMKQDAATFIGLYPSGEQVSILDVHTEAELERHDNYYPLNPHREINPREEIVFAFTPTDIFIGTKVALFKQIEKRINAASTNKRDRVILRDYYRKR